MAEIVTATPAVLRPWTGSIVETDEAKILEGSGEQGVCIVKAEAPEGKDLIIRPTKGEVLRLVSVGDQPPIYSDEEEKAIRVIFDAREGDITTDCERAYTEKMEPGRVVRVYEGVPMTALDLRGVEEIVILGKGTGRQSSGAPSVNRATMSLRAARLDGDTLCNYLRDAPASPIHVFTSAPLETYVYREPA